MLNSVSSMVLSLLIGLAVWGWAFVPLSSAQLLHSQEVYVASLFSFSGTRPSHLGVKDGSLAACPGTPNCVSSQAAQTDAEHFIAPLTYQGDAAEAIAKLASVIQRMERTAIVNQTENYLYAEFTTALMGFVDDVEFYLDPTAGVIHVRSASRLGQSDLGVNRKRIEEIRAKFAA